MAGWFRRRRGLIWVSLAGVVPGGLIRLAAVAARIVWLAGPSAGLVGPGAAWAEPRSAEPACPSAGTQIVRLAAVEARLELRLEDGRLLRLAGVDPALASPTAPDRGEEAREALSRQLAGASLSIVPASGSLDRWGRSAVFAFAAQPGEATQPGEAVQDQPGGVGGLVIASGLGRYLAEPAAHGCRTVLIAAEAKARAQKLGLWADPYYAVLSASDHAGFAERAGTLVVAEGRVTRIETGPARVKLIFAGESGDPRLNSHGLDSHANAFANSRGSQLLSATLLPRTIKLLEAHGVTISSLTGRWLRIRGLLETRFGPEIELTGPDDLELLAPGPERGEAP